MKCRISLIGAVALVALLTSSVAMADVNCATYSGTFLQALTFGGPFSETGTTDCVSYNITDRIISTEFSIVVNEQGGSELSDSLTLTNNGPGSTLEICWMSYNDGGPGTSSCSLAATVTTINYAGDPPWEHLYSGLIFDVPTGKTWYTYMTSQDIASLGESDFVGIVATPEPGSMLLLGTGFLGVAGLLRRKLNL